MQCYENQLEPYGLGVKSKEGGMVLEFFAAVNLTVRNTLSKERESHRVINPI